MRKQRSQFRVVPEEELDLKHQGSLGGELLIGRYGRGISEENISSLGQRGSEENISSFGQRGGRGSTPGREPAEGPDVAMSSPSHERWEQQTPERSPSEGKEQERPSKKHHYK